MKTITYDIIDTDTGNIETTTAYVVDTADDLAALLDAAERAGSADDDDIAYTVEDLNTYGAPPVDEW